VKVTALEVVRVKQGGGAQGREDRNWPQFLKSEREWMETSGGAVLQLGPRTASEE